MSIIDNIIDDLKSIEHIEINNDEELVTFIDSFEIIDGIDLNLLEWRKKLYLSCSEGDSYFDCEWPGSIKDYENLKNEFRWIDDSEIIMRLIIGIIRLKTKTYNYKYLLK